MARGHATLEYGYMVDRKAEDYLTRAPTDEASVVRDVDRYRDMTPAQRWEALHQLLVEVQHVLGDRVGARDPGAENFWKRWMDPSVGRPS